MSVRTEHIFHSRDGHVMRASVWHAELKAPVIVFLHGFKGFKDWGPFPAIAQRLAAAGFAVVQFNFSHNGVGDDLLNFTELDKFERNTFTRELDEVADVVEQLRTVPRAEQLFDLGRIGLLGHSRGGATAVLAGCESDSVTAVAALSPVSSFDRYTPRQKEKWRSDGGFDVLNMRTRQTMRLGVGLLDDLERNHARLDIIGAASRYPSLSKPLLVVTGEIDMTSPPKEALAIAKAAEGPLTELRIIPHGSHTFGAEHPFSGDFPRPLNEAVEAVSEFFQRALAPRGR